MDAITNLIGIAVAIFVTLGVIFTVTVVSFVVAKRRFSMRGD
jgi:uncharacterized membrane protein